MRKIAPALLGTLVLVLGAVLPANAQVVKQKKGQWSYATCVQNAQRLGHTDGVARWCSEKMQRVQAKGKRQVSN